MGLLGILATQLLIVAAEAVTDTSYEELLVRQVGSQRGMVHASCIVEAPDLSLLAVWYENGPELPPPYWSEKLDKSADVRLSASRLFPGKSSWSDPFVIADNFGIPDNNPTLIVDRDKRLWLIFPSLLGVPQSSWSSALLQYCISPEWTTDRKPSWSMQGILLPQPDVAEVSAVVLDGYARKVNEVRENSSSERTARAEVALQAIRQALEDPLRIRLGWMPRAHPIVRSDGAILLPLSNETFNISMMAFTDNGGQSWTYSRVVPWVGITQPSVVEFADGTMHAFFRNSDSEHRIKYSNSADGGLTWTQPEVVDLLHPGGGIEACVLKNGDLLMVYNDVEHAPRHSLAVSISQDRGKSWRWTRHIKNEPGGRFDYPSVVQSADGSLHVTFTDNLQSIKHVKFNEEWVIQGDP